MSADHGREHVRDAIVLYALQRLDAAGVPEKTRVKLAGDLAKKILDLLDLATRRP